jgi:GTP cyclohydrolase III
LTEGVVAALLAIAVVPVATVTPAIAVAETPVVATVKATAALRKMSAATAARKGTRLVNTRRRSVMRRFTPRKPKKKRSPRCSWQARL